MSDSFWWSLPQNGQTVARASGKFTVAPGVHHGWSALQTCSVSNRPFQQSRRCPSWRQCLDLNLLHRFPPICAEVAAEKKNPAHFDILIEKHTRARMCQMGIFRKHPQRSSRAGESGKKYVTHHFFPYLVSSKQKWNREPLFQTFWYLYSFSLLCRLDELSPVWIFFTIYLVAIHLNKHRFLQNFQFSCSFNTVQTKHMFSGFNTYWFSIFTNISWNKSYCTVFIDISKMAIMFTIYSNVGQKASVLPLCSLASTSETSK